MLLQGPHQQEAEDRSRAKHLDMGCGSLNPKAKCPPLNSLFYKLNVNTKFWGWCYCLVGKATTCEARIPCGYWFVSRLLCFHSRSLLMNLGEHWQQAKPSPALPIVGTQ